MTIKNLGGVFGRNPTFNDVTIEGQLTFDGDIDINSDLSVDGALDVTGFVTSEGLVHNGDSNTYVKFLPDRIYMDVGGNRGIDLEVNSTKIVNNGTVKLQTSSTDGLVVDANQDVQIPNGNIEMSSGHGIDFSASGTAGPELFDDYEEGTFIASFSGSGLSITHDRQLGKYTKIGNTVFFTILLGTDSVSGQSASNKLTITGLPFAMDTTYDNAGHISWAYGMGSDVSDVSWVATSSSSFDLYIFDNNSTTVKTTVLASGSNSNRLYLTGQYHTA